MKIDTVHFSITLIAGIIFLMIPAFVNAWICGTFANAIDRLGSKIMWMIPLLAFMSLFQHQMKKMDPQFSKKNREYSF